MDARVRFGPSSLLLALCLGCASSPQSVPSQEATSEACTEVQGHWRGTLYQDNIQRAYTMDLSAADSRDGFTVTLIWPTLPTPSTTIGTGRFDDGRVVWTENELLSGAGIALHGRYQAAFLDDNTLVGTYEGDTGSKGFFSLSRLGATQPGFEDVLRKIAADVRAGRGSLGRLVQGADDSTK